MLGSKESWRSNLRSAYLTRGTAHASHAPTRMKADGSHVLTRYGERSK